MFFFEKDLNLFKIGKGDNFAVECISYISLKMSFPNCDIFWKIFQVF